MIQSICRNPHGVGQKPCCVQSCHVVPCFLLYIYIYSVYHSIYIIIYIYMCVLWIFIGDFPVHFPLYKSSIQFGDFAARQQEMESVRQELKQLEGAWRRFLSGGAGLHGPREKRHFCFFFGNKPQQIQIRIHSLTSGCFFGQ